MSFHADYPTRTHTLAQFCAIAKRLDDADARKEFLDFVLTGKFTDEFGDTYQAVVDVLPNIVDNDITLETVRDFDSLILITEQLIVSAPIMVYPIPQDNETMTKTIHLNRSIDVEGERMSIPLHRIPNIKLGVWGVRNSIHLFFPQLYSTSRSPRLSLDEKRQFYESGLRPIISRDYPYEKNDWPPSLNAELFRAKNARGGHSLTSKMLPAYAAHLLAEELSEQLVSAGIEWGQEMFFVLTIRGVKGSNRHAPDPISAENTFKSFLDANDLSVDDLEHVECYVDVGLEVYDHGTDKCLQWNTLGHSQVIQSVLQIPQLEAERITSIGSSQYARDLSSHLTGVSGCRIEPGIRARGRFGAAYLQLYASDKSVTYHPEGAHYGKALKMKDALGSLQPPKFMVELMDTYFDAMKTNSSNARIEVRVPVEHCLDVLLDFNPERVRSALLAFTREEWWAFRIFRLKGFSRVFELQAAARGSMRAEHAALSLTAGCFWLVNGLHSRPEDGPAARKLMDVVLPLVDSSHGDRTCFAYRVAVAQEREEGTDDDGSLDDDVEVQARLDNPPRQRHTVADRQIGQGLVPYIPFGVIFFRDMRFNKIPRLRRENLSMSPQTFKFWFDCYHEEIVERFSPEGIIHTSQIPAARITRNRTQRTLDITSNVAEPLPLLFSLSGEGITLAPPCIDDGSDTEDVNISSDPISGNVDRVVTDIYRQFLVDVANKAPNMGGRSSRSYLKLTEAERAEVTEELYTSERLSKHWRRLHYFPGGKGDWALALTHIFPPKDKDITSSMQNYRQSTYYRRWLRLREANNHETVDAVRAALCKRVWRTLKWIPHACSDRMWGTQYLTRFQSYPASTHARRRPAAPRILTKRGVTYEWVDEEADVDGNGEIVV